MSGYVVGEGAPNLKSARIAIMAGVAEGYAERETPPHSVSQMKVREFVDNVFETLEEEASESNDGDVSYQAIIMISQRMMEFAAFYASVLDTLAERPRYGEPMSQEQRESVGLQGG